MRINQNVYYQRNDLGRGSVRVCVCVHVFGGETRGRSELPC